MATLAACQTSTDLEEIVPTATGSWSGIGAAGFTLFELFLDISEDPVGRLSGTARLESPGQESFEFVIREGAHGHPDLLVSMATENFVDVNFSGRFIQQDSIEGRVNGSGFNNAPVTVVRRQDAPQPQPAIVQGRAP